ncbi:MAG: hypothetical protein CVV59_01105 [Tenericutes bacterium HGW-Tenericutes-4]|nr:MAG: hypothetical protein CVV59_01105 [Tenericutes bacterium HGW-Tenericutes-4]
MKQNYYVFLDIDGVLWAWPNRKKEIHAGNIKMGSRIREFDPSSMLALGVLLDSLNKRYNVTLVITSSWQEHMKDLMSIMKKYNTPKVFKIEITGRRGARGPIIFDHLKDKQDKENFCIVDDETSDMPEFLHSDKIIKTKGMHKGSLTLKQVHKFLNKIGVPIVQTSLSAPKNAEIQM